MNENKQEAIMEVLSEDANSNHLFHVHATPSKENIVIPSLFPKTIMEAENSSEVVTVRSFIKLKPINELLAVPLIPIEDPVKEQNVEVIKSFSKLAGQSKLKEGSNENKHIKNSNLQDNIQPKQKDSSSLPLELDKQKADNQLPLSEDEILLNDADVLRMDLSQELDVSLQCKENLSEKSRKQIFIGNIPASLKKQHITQFFERYGKIKHLKFIRSKNHETIICFITYDSLNAARTSLETNGLFYHNRNLRVSRVGRVPVLVHSTIVVTSLPIGTSNQDLYGLFELCGLIKSLYLVEETGKLVAYITFELKVSANYALLLNNFLLKGRRVFVCRYNKQREKQGLSNLIS